MKKLITLLAIITTIATFAQAPQGFNYQATVRNSAGALIVNQIVLVKFNILQNSSNGTIVYSENQTANTDDLGHINLVVGQGTSTTGTFSAINWGIGNYYLGIELDTGNGYVTMGTTQLLSVPYALYANSSGNSSTPNLASVLAVNNGANNLQIKNLADPTVAQDAATKGYIDSQITALQAQITALQSAIVTPLQNVSIGTQIWSSTNLEVRTYRDGTPIPQVTDPTAWANLTTGAYCYYNNNPIIGDTYGVLYNWYAVAGIYDAASLNDPSLRKQFAPTGWHVPSDTEWSTLINYLDPNANGGSITPNIAGGAMKETGTTHWASPNSSATNSSGFKGLPGGYRSASGGTFIDISYRSNWWSSSEFDASSARRRNVDYDFGNVGRSNIYKTFGFSVRCIKN